MITGKLAVPQIAIVGLGGTGSYILDLIAKTPVHEIHLFDGDRYLQHNAFRAPGAPTIEDLRQRPMKVDYLAAKYSAMRRGIFPHAYRLEAPNVTELDEMTFVFLTIDEGPAKETIIDRLEMREVPFIDVGMGVYEVDGRRRPGVTSSRDRRRPLRPDDHLPPRASCKTPLPRVPDLRRCLREAGFCISLKDER